jgi:ferritin-like metal-binding protein YciE
MAGVNEKSRETITKYLGDMHALESHGLEAISRQVTNLEGSDHKDALTTVQGFKRTLDSHVQALESRLKALGDSPTSPVKDAASAVAGVAAGLYNKVRNEEASKSIRDDYTFLSHSAVAYLMMHTTAMSLGDQETARLAERGYRDAARMVMEIDHILPKLVIDELRQDGLQVKDVAEECRKLIHDSWTRGAGQTGMRSASSASSL